MKLSLVFLLLGLTAPTALPDSNFYFDSFSVQSYLTGYSPTDLDNIANFTISGPDGTLSGRAGHDLSPLHLNGGPGETLPISTGLDFTPDSGSRVSGVLDGAPYSNIWCDDDNSAVNFETLAPFTLPGERQGDFIVTVPAEFPGIGGVTVGGGANDGCGDYEHSSGFLGVGPVFGSETFTFEPLEGNQGWRLIEGDFASSPEPSTLSTGFVILLFFGAAKFLRRKAIV